MKVIDVKLLPSGKYRVEFDVGTFDLDVEQEKSGIIGIQGPHEFYVETDKLDATESKVMVSSIIKEIVAYVDRLCLEET